MTANAPMVFQLIGTTYGGDGQSTFALPDLRGRVPIHMGTGPGLSNRPIAEAAGVEEVTLTVQQLPAHSHAPVVSSDAGTQLGAAGAVRAAGSTVTTFRPAPPTQAMAATAMLTLLLRARSFLPHLARLVLAQRSTA